MKQEHISLQSDYKLTIVFETHTEVRVQVVNKIGTTSEILIRTWS